MTERSPTRYLSCWRSLALVRTPPGLSSPSHLSRTWQSLTSTSPGSSHGLVAGRPLSAAILQRTADGLVGEGDGWRHNQALLDHGALVCTARTPSCEGCTLRRSCAWRRGGSTAPDPAATTAGTSRPQSRFEGSQRQARGAVLTLVRGGPADAAAIEALRRRHGEARIDAAIDALGAEGIVGRLDGTVLLVDR